MEEARRRETTQEEQERLARLMSAQFASGLMGVSVSGPAADAYIAAGLAGVEAASAMTTSERFGKRTFHSVSMFLKRYQNFHSITLGATYLIFFHNRC